MFSLKKSNIFQKLNIKSMKNEIKFQEDVMEHLNWEPFSDVSKVDVAAKNRFASHSWQLDTDSKNDLVRKTVRQLARIRNIDEELGNEQFESNLRIVKLENYSFELWKRINMAFHRSPNIDPAKIKVKVSGRMVTLTGSVNSIAQKEEAEDTAWLVPGVTSVDSEFVINKQEYSLNAYNVHC